MNIPTAEIEKVTFHVLGDSDNLIDSHVNITNKELFKDQIPFESGIYDLRLGTSDYAFKG